MEIFIEKYVKIAGYNSLSIHVLKRNPSADFYLKMGGILYKEMKVDIAGGTFDMLVFGWDGLK